jgi:glutaredoxin
MTKTTSNPTPGKNKKPRYSQDQIIERFISIHGNKYDYSKFIFTSVKNKGIIICPEHGEFEQRISNHLNGLKCSKCVVDERSRAQALTQNQFIQKCKNVHGDKYDYSEAKYFSSSTKVDIICLIHGVFTQNANRHMMGNGCPNCKKAKPLLTHNLSLYINKFIEKHNNYYDYSKVVYNGVDNDIIIACPKHGDFNCTISNHAGGKGCPKCRRSKGELAISRFLENNNIEFKEQAKFGGCRHRRNLPFDFYVPSYNLCIEFQGEQHFKITTGNWKNHDLEYRQKLDNIKREFCRRTNLNLLEITYKENIQEKLELWLQRNQN